LEVGAVSDTVTVTPETTLVQSESAERSLAIEGETLRSIAVNGRGFTPLASIVPGFFSIPTTVRAMRSPIFSPTGCAAAPGQLRTARFRSPEQFQRQLGSTTCPRRRGAAVRGSLNDWQISGIYRYQTGAPYDVGFSIPGLSSYGVTGTQQNEGGRIVVVGNPGSGTSSDPYHQFHVAAFTTPGLGSTGLESGRNFLYRSPINSWDISWDISRSKEFRFKERARIELHLDTFNTLNHTQFDMIHSTLNVTGLTSPTPTNWLRRMGTGRDSGRSRQCVHRAICRSRLASNFKG
jgi:hypothetical protein